MAVTAANVTARAKEFASLTADEINLAIDDAELQINRTVWGDKADLATIYLAAHILSIQNPSLVTAVGPIQSEKVGQVSRTYAVSVSTNQGTQYGSSRWGREYLRLRAQLPSSLVLNLSGV
jgi:hypothetical protein